MYRIDFLCRKTREGSGHIREHIEISNSVAPVHCIDGHYGGKVKCLSSNQVLLL